jgi:Bacterial capsule synthesis protein PGA_cap
MSGDRIGVAVLGAGRARVAVPRRRWVVGRVLATTLLLHSLAIGAMPVIAAEATPTPSGTSTDVIAPSASPVAPTSAEGPMEDLPVALVPVVDFWSSRRSIDLAGLRRALAGDHRDIRQVLVAEPYLESLSSMLGVSLGASVQSASVEEVLGAVRRSRRTLGIVPAGAVVPTVRALAFGGTTLFGGERARTLDGWPLTVPSVEGSAPDEAAFDPATTWTIAAAGDVMLDREVYRQAVILDKGPDYPWDGGVARITARTCCNAFGGPEITARRAGRPGAVRQLLEGADIAIVNHEGPAPDDFKFNPHGLRFSFDPALEAGLAGAGIDVVSLGNNHIRDAGSSGVIETIRNVRAAGILTAGAGSDERAAREPACLDRSGQRVCVLAYDAVDLADAATGARPGAAHLRTASVKRDVWQARQEGADVVVVVPHWGVEYVESRTGLQRRHAKAIVDAGADVILGAHSHVVGAMESIRGVPVLYSMGNFIFDLTRFEQTLEGVIVELTFAGDRLLQVELHPTVLMNLSQANLLDPERDGRVVLRRMRDASEGLYP